MNFKLVTCYRRQKYPKLNVASKNADKKKSSGKKKRKKSSSHHRQHRVKSSYIPSDFSQNFYPANYFFQDDQKIQIYDTRVGVNDRNGYLITRNTPQPHHSRRFLPSSQSLSQQYLWKVGFLSFWFKIGHQIYHQNQSKWSGRNWYEKD